MKILNFGSLNLDYVYRVPRFVQPGETLSADSQSVNPGGKGLNQSIALAKAGAEVYHAGCVGAGGEMLKQILRQNRVNTDLLCPVDTLQGNAVIQVNASGENCILLYGGSNQCITEPQVRDTLSRFSPEDYLVLQNEINLLPLIVDTAFERSLKIFLNPSPWNSKLEAVDFSRLSWLLVNEIEAEQVSGSDDPDTAWRRLHEKYPDLSLLVTLGGSGSVAYTKEETVRCPAHKVQPVDTTAAGDTYTGYFISGLIRGLPLQRCMQRASLAAAVAVTRPGAASSIPSSEEVDHLLSAEII